MIPKVINYCWFGRNPLPDSVLKCMDSWKKYCPDYEIKQWNEDNFDIGKSEYAKEAYEAKKWAFVSDYARLDIIYNNGGIYLDTDVELIRNLDPLLKNKCFLGIEQPSHLISTGLGFGAEKKNENIKEMLDEYKNTHFTLKKDIFDKTPCPYRNTNPFYKYGFNKEIKNVTDFNGARIYPPEYFCPFERKLNKLTITENTYSIHNFGSSWISDEEKQLYSNIKEYEKTHSRLRTKIYKNKLECINKYGNANPFSMLKMLLFKLKKRYIQNKDKQKIETRNKAY